MRFYRVTLMAGLAALCGCSSAEKPNPLADPAPVVSDSVAGGGTVSAVAGQSDPGRREPVARAVGESVGVGAISPVAGEPDPAGVTPAAGEQAEQQVGSAAAPAAVASARVASVAVAPPDLDELIAARLDSGSEGDRLATEAVRLIGEGEYAEASEKINKALQGRIDKSYYHLINGLAYHLMLLQGNGGSMELAQQGYAMAIQFDSGNWLAYYLMGNLYLEAGKFKEALKPFSEAMLIRPDDRELLNSFTYASYRAGAPDLAVGGITGLEKLGALDDEVSLRNAALVMSALGERERAKAYFAEMAAKSRDPWIRSQVERRLGDWERFHDSLPKIEPVQYGAGVGGYGAAPSYGGMSGAMGGGSMPGVLPPTAPGTEGKMVVVDVVMIRSEETFNTAKGINLLNGLQLQFGDTANSLPAFRTSYAKAATDTGSTAGDSGSTARSLSFTRALTIPAITYTLNIFNANNQNNEILARPTLVALAGQPSEFFSGVDLNAAATSNTLGGQAIQIAKQIGVKLSVTPTFMESGRVRLQVTAERTFMKTPSQDVNFTYRIETTMNKVSANVEMRYGETLILGGLSEKETENGRDGTPGLQDIPLLQLLFARQTTKDFQKSVLILLTPRPPQYVYQPERARLEYEKSLSEDEREVAALRSRYSEWFKPYPNWASVFHHMQENSLFREFRTGDVTLEKWSDMRSVKSRLRQLLEYLYY
ncbi:MAG: hypothetical protein HQL57_02770 [Magnetococcales bacterium]|nr:hypothetical protein [Magnetococcales bacterium]MBF0156091.1 hypothetical protein [Magnetococcales bacterium]